MDGAYVELTTRLVTLAVRLLEERGEDFAQGMVTEHVGFVGRELGV